MTNQELHLPDVFAALVAAQKALDEGDMEAAADHLGCAGFSLCCCLSAEFAERAPDSWFDSQS